MATMITKPIVPPMVPPIMWAAFDPVWPEVVGLYVVV